MRREPFLSRGLLVLFLYVLAVAPVHAAYIVPIAAHSPQVIFSMTTERNPDDTDFFIVNSTTISAPETMPDEMTPHYEVATWDTGAPLHILSRDAFDAFDLAGAGKTGSFPAPLVGVDAINSDPLGIYTGGFGSVTATTPSLAVDTSSFKGQYNVSVVYAQAGETLPMIVGTPLSSQYISVFDYANPQILTIDGEEFRSPEVTLAEFDALPDPDRRLQLTVAAGLSTNPLSFTSLIVNFDDFGDDPFLPTFGPSYYLDANIDHDGNNRDFLDMIYDTGSQGTFVSEFVAATLGFDVINDAPDFTVQLQTLSGTTDTVPGFFADQLELPGTDGGIVLTNVPLIVFNLPDVRSPGNILDGLIGQNLFGDRIVTFDPELALNLGDPGPILGISDPALDNHDWNSIAASASFNDSASWASPGTPALDWIAHTQNNAAFDQTAVVDSDVSVSALNIIGDADKMTVSIDASTTLTVFGTVIVTDNGELHLNGGTVDPLAIELRGGSLTGHGDVAGEVTSQGLIAPGDSAGVLHFLGNVDQLAQGTLAIEIAGTNNSDPQNPEFDQLDIDGNTTLDGTLTLQGTESLPSIGDHPITILTASSVSGTFANVPPPNNGVDQGHIGHGQFFEGINYNPTNAIVNIFQAAAGDTNGDKFVDTDDITNILSAALFETGEFGDWTQGDFTGDFLVDTEDITAILNLALFETGAYAANPTAEGTPADGIMDLVVNPDGTTFLDTNGVAISGFVIESLGGNLQVITRGTFSQASPGLPLGGFNVSTAFKASAQFFNTTLFPGGITGIINLGQLFGPDGSVALLSDLNITYNVLDTEGTFAANCIGCVPEPSSLVLAVFGLLGLVGCWRRRTNS